MPLKIDAKVLLLFLLVPVWLIASSALQGNLGNLGPDGDDVMRLVQVKDLLNGQAWFDLHQYRMGPDGGTAMHWSRLVDVPILVLYGLFDLFLPPETALIWAYSAWPPLSVLIVLAGLYVGGRHLEGRAGGFACLVLAAFIYATHYRFSPGAIDHHNVQLGLLAVALGLALDPKRRPARLAGAGLALAASVAIGGEVYGFVAVFCGFIALDWAVTGRAARRGAMGFGAGLAAGLEIAFFMTVSPAQYELVACDALSAVSLTAGMVGGLGLASVALVASGRSWPVRCAALCLVGGACVLTLILVGPQCMSNPLDDLSPEVKTLWLDRVDEARSMISGQQDMIARLGFCLGITVLALGICTYGVIRQHRVRANLLFCALLTAAMGMALYQVRFYVFGHLFAVIPLGLWVADTYRAGKARNPSSVAYIGALALSLPLVWGVPGLLLAPEMEKNAAGDKADCLQDDLFAVLNALPAGRILTSADFGPILLNRTDHSVIQGNYHRNQEGIAQSIAMLLSPVGESHARLQANGIDYVIACPADAETRLLSSHAPDGLAARLKRGEIPEFMESVDVPATFGSAATIYRIKPAALNGDEQEDLS